MISLFEIENLDQRKAQMEAAKGLAKQLELRDGITLVFGEKGAFADVVPSTAGEALVRFDPKTGTVACEHTKSHEPPLVRLSLALLGSFALMLGANLLNLQYVDYLSGKVRPGTKDPQ